MQRIRILLMAAAIAGLLARPAAAQEEQAGFNVSVGGGVTIPVDEFNDAADLGWHGLASLGVTSSSSIVGFRGDFFYGENNAAAGDRDFRLIGGLGNLLLNIGESARFRPYLIGSAGYFNVKIDRGGSESDIVAGGGLGIKIPAGSDANVFVEGRFINVFAEGTDTQFVPITAGIQFFTR